LHFINYETAISRLFDVGVRISFCRSKFAQLVQRSVTIPGANDLLGQSALADLTSTLDHYNPRVTKGSANLICYKSFIQTVMGKL